jgi:hypothetical protein
LYVVRPDMEQKRQATIEEHSSAYRVGRIGLECAGVDLHNRIDNIDCTTLVKVDAPRRELDQII